MENQNLIKEKISLNDELIEESNKNKRLELKIKELEAELENENKKQNQTLINNDCGDDKKIIDELNKKLIEEIENNTLLKEKVLEQQSLLENKNELLDNCITQKEEKKKKKTNLTENIQNLYQFIELLNLNTIKIKL